MSRLDDETVAVRAATPAESALHFCHCYQSTAPLGGDFFNVVPVSETDAGIFIRGVMGHGSPPRWSRRSSAG